MHAPFLADPDRAETLHVWLDPPIKKKIENARICWTTIDINDLEMVITKEIVKIQAKKYKVNATRLEMVLDLSFHRTPLKTLLCRSNFFLLTREFCLELQLSHRCNTMLFVLGLLEHDIFEPLGGSGTLCIDVRRPEMRDCVFNDEEGGNRDSPDEPVR